MRDTFLPFALPDLDEAELAEIKEALDSGWITTGPKVRQFEAEFAARVGVPHAVAVNSGTAALHLALEAAGLGRGDQVILPAYTFAATAEVVRYFDAEPVLVDVCPDDLNIDPGLAEAAITGRTRAIISVHVAGLPAALDAIYAIAARHDLAIIEDAAHAFPSKYKGHTIGVPLLPQSVGERSELRAFVAFSFYATKPITTGEGGMLTTADQTLADRCRITALHGISKDAWKRYTAEGSWYYEIVAPGFKYNMTDVAAGMGLAQLRKAERMWQRRREIAECYNSAFNDVPALQIPHDRGDCQHAWHLYMLRLNLEQLRIGRAQFVEELKRCNIGTSVHFIPLHLHPYYRGTYGYRPGDFPVAYREYQREISLPIYSKMNDRDVQDVIDAVIGVVEHHRY
jgi:dTDP-4-amino-4,6-dideoxygalactose transaminase